MASLSMRWDDDYGSGEDVLLTCYASLWRRSAHQVTQVYSNSVGRSVRQAPQAVAACAKFTAIRIRARFCASAYQGGLECPGHLGLAIPHPERPGNNSSIPPPFRSSHSSISSLFLPPPQHYTIPSRRRRLPAPYSPSNIKL